MKNVLVTGGAGFVGSNLIKHLKENNPNIKITSLDNYFTGKKEHHIPGVEYVYGNTWEAKEKFEKLKEEEYFDTVFHFGEYSRIVQSFDDIEYVAQTNMAGTPQILELCKKWNAKLIYSASSSKFGNDGKDENLSPYAWMKAKMVEYIKNYNEWFGLEYQICYFFNVYGPGQIMTGDYATVIGIFERQYNAGQKCTVVEPGTQSRDFTHVNDIVSGVVKSAEYLHTAVNDNHDSIGREWYLRSGVERSIIDVAEMYGEWEFIPERRGERLNSTTIDNDTCERLGWKPTHSLEEWIESVKIKQEVNV